MYMYNAKVVAVYDGDTITIEIDHGMFIKSTQKIRLYGINTPELKGKSREKGLISRDKLRDLILDQEIIIKTYKDKKGKYGRFLGDIFLPLSNTEDSEAYIVSGEDLGIEPYKKMFLFINLYMIEKGYAKIYK